MVRGMHIVVLDKNHSELGEGTFEERSVVSASNLIAYECREHVILASGVHYVKINGEIYAVNPPPQKS